MPFKFQFYSRIWVEFR